MKTLALAMNDFDHVVDTMLPRKLLHWQFDNSVQKREQMCKYIKDLLIFVIIEKICVKIMFTSS